MNGNNLYTILVEYDGGTYISQEYANNPIEAVRYWSRNEESEGFLKQLNRSERIELQQDFYDSDLVRIKRNINVWCDTTNIAGKFLLLHCIQTAKSVKDKNHNT
jgi:hypothetical protein